MISLENQCYIQIVRSRDLRLYIYIILYCVSIQFLFYIYIMPFIYAKKHILHVYFTI